MEVIIVDPKLAETLEAQGLKLKTFSDVNGVLKWKVFCDEHAFNISSSEKEGRCVAFDRNLHYL